MVIPARVLDAYGLVPSSIQSVSGGLINATYLARGDSGTSAVALQRLHPIFGPEVNLDIEAVTEHLAGKGLITPRLVRTKNGQAWIEDEGQCWRAITWIEGSCHQRVQSETIAESGAELVAHFHRALDDFDYEFRFARAGVHDTPAHLRRLAAATSSHDDALAGDALALRSEIARAIALAPALPPLPQRICHGDLKISNLLFGERDALCLVDLDTMGWQTIAYELGDALRSWSNVHGEDREQPEVDTAIIAAAARGYARGSEKLLSAQEVASVITGLETVCIELAARFCLDVFDDSYFGWDAKRFGSRREHNLVRARGQLALAHSVAVERDAIQAIWRAPFAD